MATCLRQLRNFQHGDDFELTHALADARMALLVWWGAGSIVFGCLVAIKPPNFASQFASFRPNSRPPCELQIAASRCSSNSPDAGREPCSFAKISKIATLFCTTVVDL